MPGTTSIAGRTSTQRGCDEVMISNARLFEFFPSSDFVLLGKEMGLTNPIIPRDGWVNYPENGAGWGCEWDWDYFEKKRTAVY